MALIEAIRQSTAHWSNPDTRGSDVAIIAHHGTETSGRLSDEGVLYRIGADAPHRGKRFFMVDWTDSSGKSHNVNDYIEVRKDRSIRHVRLLAILAGMLGAPEELIHAMESATQLMEHS